MSALGKALREARKDNSEKGVEKLLELCENEFPKIDGEPSGVFLFSRDNLHCQCWDGGAVQTGM